jgi:transcriptional regulator with XRE-family HTH domain
MSPLLKQQVVGEHVRRLRQRVGFSLRALAARTDFSPSFISQLENGLVSPSIHSMEKIAGALGVTLAAFFAHVGPGAGGLVTRARQRGKLASSWSHAAIEALSPMNGQQRLEPLLISLRPGGRSGKHPVPHRNEEFALVMKGRPTLRLGPDEHKLGPGDSVTLLPNELRLWTNPGRAICSVLIVALRGAP